MQLVNLAGHFLQIFVLLLLVSKSLAAQSIHRTVVVVVLLSDFQDYNEHGYPKSKLEEFLDMPNQENT